MISVRKLGLILFILTLTLCKNSLSGEFPVSVGTLAEKKAQISLELSIPIAKCVERNDTGHPVFHGCIDWHSSVHGTWALIAYSRATGDRRYESLIERMLDRKGLEREQVWLESHPDFEMPYGRAWFLRLAIEHHRQYGSDLLRPIAELVSDSLVSRYRRAPPVPLSGSYDSDTWALINLLDYGREIGNARTVEFVESLVRRYFMDLHESCEEAENKPEFMAVCTNICWLVAKVLPKDEFNAWFQKHRGTVLRLAPVTAPRTTHEYGKNFSRTWGLWGLYIATGDARIAEAYKWHFLSTYNRRDHWAGDYRSVAHWVAQFGIFGLQPLFDMR
jgi:Protein of unknown function (DUF2891)